MADQHQNLYPYQVEWVEQGKCSLCHGCRVIPGRAALCGKCLGTGEPTAEDLRGLERYHARLCGICGLPWVDGTAPTSKYTPSEPHDCLDQLRQHVEQQRLRLDRLEEIVRGVTR